MEPIHHHHHEKDWVRPFLMPGRSKFILCLFISCLFILGLTLASIYIRKKIKETRRKETLDEIRRARKAVKKAAKNAKWAMKKRGPSVKHGIKVDKRAERPSG